MDRLFFYFFYISVRLLAFLPLRVLFVLSDINFFFLYYIFKYRKKTVRKNLKKSFPEKSKEELRKIEVRFYRHFCDLFVEVYYTLFVSKRRAKKLV
ncbi:MAG TPA: acetyltransferase, partial [Tenuifilaceae bacterium]|nr:acetyltransferase [Tenuifilaceae bacterium]